MTPERDWPRLFATEACDTSTSSRLRGKGSFFALVASLDGREREVREQSAAQIAPRWRTIRGPSRVRRTPSSGHGLRTGTAEVSRAVSSARVASVPRTATAAASRWVSRRPAASVAGQPAALVAERAYAQNSRSADGEHRRLLSPVAATRPGALPLSRRSMRPARPESPPRPPTSFRCSTSTTGSIPDSPGQLDLEPSHSASLSSTGGPPRSRSSVSTSSSILRSSSSGTWTVNRMPARSNSTSLC